MRLPGVYKRRAVSLASQPAGEEVPPGASLPQRASGLWNPEHRGLSFGLRFPGARDTPRVNELARPCGSGADINETNIKR